MNKFISFYLEEVYSGIKFLKTSDRTWLQRIVTRSIFHPISSWSIIWI